VIQDLGLFYAFLGIWLYLTCFPIIINVIDFGNNIVIVRIERTIHYNVLSQVIKCLQIERKYISDQAKAETAM